MLAAIQPACAFTEGGKTSDDATPGKSPAIHKDNKASSNGDSLLKWVIEEGGYWNPKQILRYENDDEQTGLFGVFALEAIQEEEVLARIPWSAVIYVDDDDDAPEENRFASCSLVQRLQQELDKGNLSHYKYYTQALRQTAQDHYHLLPAHWSAQGRALLEKVLGRKNSTGSSSSNGKMTTSTTTLPPRDMFLRDFEWKHKCSGAAQEEGSIISPEATLLVMTHGEDFGMVPLTDRYNSRGGSYTGAYFVNDAEVNSDIIALEIRALRDIPRGEQIFTDYHDYGLIGTPELLRDYGFVESYPQLYIFHDQRIAFKVEEVVRVVDEEEEDEDYEEEHEEEEEDEPVYLQVKWKRQIDNEWYMLPKMEKFETRNFIVQFLHTEYQRLQQVCAMEESDEVVLFEPEHTKNETDGDVKNPQGKALRAEEAPASNRQHEIETTAKLCSDMTRAIRAALLDLGLTAQNMDGGSSNNHNPHSCRQKDDGSSAGATQSTGENDLCGHDSSPSESMLVET
ncbi:hypothetical protein ACA910_016227 [Epithemia clementina (nom. ined.)]